MKGRYTEQLVELEVYSLRDAAGPRVQAGRIQNS